jgi:hypothetical protein
MLTNPSAIARAGRSIEVVYEGVYSLSLVEVKFCGLRVDASTKFIARTGYMAYKNKPLG